MMSNKIVWSTWLVLNSCTVMETPDYVAKVGERVLLRSTVDSLFPADGATTARETYIKNWIDSEVLYQKASAAGLLNEVRVKEEMERLTRQFLVQTYLDREIERRLNISKEEIEAYFKQHEDEYVLTEDHIKSEYFLTRDRAKAKQLEEQFARMSRLRKKDFLEIVNQVAGDSDVVGEREFLPRDAYEEKIAKYVFLKNATDEIIGPILTSQGYYSLWHVVEIRPAGSPRALSSVEPQIEQRLRMIKRKQKTEELLKQLRSEMPIEYGRSTP